MPLQIATSGRGDVSITDETKLMRYMRLSTFLVLLCNNRLFLPTAGKLQESDFREANLQLYWCQDYWRIEFSGHDSDPDFLNPLSAANEPLGVFQDLD